MAWYNNSWNYRFKVTIQSSQVEADLTDFPIYVDLSDFPADFFNNVNSDGSDIRVTRSDGTTECPIDLVFITTGSSIGELHFKSNSILGASNVDFYVYCGNSGASAYGATDTYGRNNVWTDYEAVYHLQEDPDVTDMLDSTGNGHTGFVQAGMSASNVTDGKLGGKGLVFGGASNERVQISDDTGFDWGSALCVTAWGQTASLAADGTIFSKNGGGTSEPLLWFDAGTNDFTVACHIGSFYNGSSGGSYTTRSINTWYYMAGKYDGSALQMRINKTNNYNNSAPSGTVTGTTAALGIGGQYDNARLLNGKVDEVRVSLTAFSDNRLDTEYNNQNDTSAFYSVGTAETQTVSYTSPFPSFRR